MKVGVVTFPGSLDDVDAQRAVRVGGHEAVALWHGDHDLRGVDAVVLPGGFSYGDYLRCGAISRFSPVMTEVVEAAGRGMPVLGICNGFQILCESHLLPGALIRNDHRKFVCRDQRLRIENNRTAWTSSYAEGAEVTIVLKNGEGGFVADAETLDRIEGEGQVVARYLDDNPNGSLRDIAGITNERGNVVGLMPHPEHAVEDAHRRRHRRARLLHLAGRRDLRLTPGGGPPSARPAYRPASTWDRAPLALRTPTAARRSSSGCPPAVRPTTPGRPRRSRRCRSWSARRPPPPGWSASRVPLIGSLCLPEAAFSARWTRRTSSPDEPRLRTVVGPALSRVIHADRENIAVLRSPTRRCQRLTDFVRRPLQAPLTRPLKTPCSFSRHLSADTWPGFGVWLLDGALSRG